MDMQVTQRVEFECCYLQPDRLNAHRYKVEATVFAPQRYHDTGQVIEFSELRRIMRTCVPDNAFVYCAGDTGGISSDIAVVLKRANYPTWCLSTLVTAESLCEHIATTLQDRLTFEYPGVTVQEVKLRETTDSFVVWRRK